MNKGKDYWKETGVLLALLLAFLMGEFYGQAKEQKLLASGITIGKGYICHKRQAATPLPIDHRRFHSREQN